MEQNPQVNSAPQHTAKTVHEQLKEHNKEPKMFTWPPNSPKPNLTGIEPEQAWSHSMQNA